MASTEVRRIRVVIVDDHPLLRDGTRAVFDRESDIEVVAACGSGAEALSLVAQHLPDVLLLDLRLPDIGGIEVAQRLRVQCHEVAIVVLTGVEQAGYVRALHELGVRGYLQKTMSSVDIVTAVRAVASGRTAFSSMTGDEADLTDIELLTARERDVLTLLALGRRNSDIAAEWSVSIKTIEFHVGNVLSKLSAKSRTEAIHIARQHGILSSEG